MGTDITIHSCSSSLSDNGGEFISALINALHDSLQVNIIHGLPYHPQTQGVIERSHQTIKRKFWSNVHELQLDPTNLSFEEAKQILQNAITIYNHECHTTTKMIPFELFMGRTDRNFSLPSSIGHVTEKTFSVEEMTTMIAKAKANMIARAGKEIAR